MFPWFECKDAVNKTLFDVIPLGIHFYKPSVFSIIKRMDLYFPLEYMVPTANVQNSWITGAPFCPVRAFPNGIEITFWMRDQHIRLVPKSEPLPDGKMTTYHVLNVIR